MSYLKTNDVCTHTLSPTHCPKDQKETVGGVWHCWEADSMIFFERVWGNLWVQKSLFLVKNMTCTPPTSKRIESIVDKRNYKASDLIWYVNV